MRMKDHWTAEELARKRPIWVALSDLFLDTEVRAFLPGIALRAMEHGYSEQELWETLDREVAPVLSPNLLSVAGEWACFDEEWLCQKIAAGGPGGRENFLKRIANRAGRFLYREYRPPLALLLEHLETRLEPEQEAAKLSDLTRLYIEKDWARLFSLWSILGRLSRFSIEELNDAFEAVIDRAYEGLLTGPDDPTPEQARENFDWYLRLLERGVPVQVAEQLSYFLVVENLAVTPRWEIVRQELGKSGMSLDEMEELLFGLLSEIYKGREVESWGVFREGGL